MRQLPDRMKRNGKLTLSLLLVCFCILAAGTGGFKISVKAADKDLGITDSGAELFPQYQDGLYGYVDEVGEFVIGAYFTEAESFENGIAIVKTDERWGAIDESGGYVIKPMYRSISRLGDALFAVEDEHYWFGACDTAGNIVIEPEFEDLFLMDGYIFADLPLQTDNGWYTVFDSQGNPVIGEGSALPEAYAVELPEETKIYSTHFYGEPRANKYGYESGEWYGYLKSDFTPLSDACYEKINSFGCQDYAVATYRLNPYNYYDSTETVVVRGDGREICTLPESYYTECNGYFAFGGSQLLDLETLETKECEFAIFVPMSSCVIAEDPDTGLYGLYDGTELVYDYVYNDIDYYEGDSGSTNTDIVLVRGNETTEYLTPRIMPGENTPAVESESEVIDAGQNVTDEAAVKQAVAEQIQRIKEQYPDPVADYEAASKDLLELLGQYRDSQELSDLYDWYMEYAPLPLFTMQPYISSTWYPSAATSVTDNLGNQYEKGIVCGSVFSGDAYYNLDRKYDVLKGVAAVQQGDTDVYGTIQIFGDDRLLWENTQMDGRTRPEQFELDVTGIQDLRIYMAGGYYTFSSVSVMLADLTLQKTTYEGQESAAVPDASEQPEGTPADLPQESGAETGTEYLLPNSASVYLSEQELSGFTQEQLELARNEIYARHGRKFTTERIRDYFLSKSWYQELYEPEEFDSMTDSFFNEFEKANIDTIWNYEVKMGYQ